MNSLAPLLRHGHLASNFAAGISRCTQDRANRFEHPQGILGPKGHAGSNQGNYVRVISENYHVPDGSDARYPVPKAGEPIYVWRAQSGAHFIGGWMEASDFSATGKIEARYIDGSGTKRALRLAGLSAPVGGNSDAFFIEQSALAKLAHLPISGKFDVVFVPDVDLSAGQSFHLVFLYTN